MRRLLLAPLPGDAWAVGRGTKSAACRGKDWRNAACRAATALGLPGRLTDVYRVGRAVPRDGSPPYLIFRVVFQNSTVSVPAHLYIEEEVSK